MQLDALSKIKPVFQKDAIFLLINIELIENKQIKLLKNN